MMIGNENSGSLVMQYRLLSPESLIPTEDVDPDRVAGLQDVILRHGFWTVPIAVERNALFVMDGHHRLAVAQRLRFAVVPVVLRDYCDVKVESWRPGMTITPARIFAMARSGRKFLFVEDLPDCALPLGHLRHPGIAPRFFRSAPEARP